MVAKGGARLLDDEAIEAMQAELLPRAFVVTPNVPEAAALAGMPVSNVDEARAAAERIAALGAARSSSRGATSPTTDAIDVFFDGREFVELRAPRIATRHTHGTGCTFSSAIAANLALGRPLGDAVARAKAYVTDAIRQAPGLGGGHGPLGHFLDRNV